MRRSRSPGKTIGAEYTNRRVLEPVETCITAWSRVILLALTVVFGLFREPWPIRLLCATWIGLALLSEAYKLRRAQKFRDSNSR